MIDFKGHRIEKAIILYRWVQKFTPQMEAAFRKGRKRPVGTSWRMDETYRYCWRTRFLTFCAPLSRLITRQHSLIPPFLTKLAPISDSLSPPKRIRQQHPYIKIKGKWRYLYRAVDRDGQTLDFLLTAQRDKKAALRFLRKAVRQHGLPEKVTINKSGANTAALEALQEETGTKIEIRQTKYLNAWCELIL